MLPLDVRPEIWATLSPYDQSRIEQLSAWPLGYVREELASSADLGAKQVDSILVEYRRYLALSILDPNTKHAPTAQVDQAWHRHLLDTKDYWQLCSEVIGRFIHHVPHGRARGEEAPSDIDATVWTIRRTFEYHDEALWRGSLGKCTRCSDDASPGFPTVVLLAA